MEGFLNPHDNSIGRKETKPEKSKFHPLPSNSTFVIATAASSGYIDNVLNLIGSIHFYEPNLKIMVYDIGLTLSQSEKLICLKNVVLVPFSSVLDDRPQKFSRELFSYSWKPFVISHAFAVTSSFLFIDAGTEIWQSLSNPLVSVGNPFESITKHCHLFFNQETLTSLIHPDSLDWMQVEFQTQFDVDLVLSKRHISGGLIGLSRECFENQPDEKFKISIEKLLEDWRLCASDSDCMSPEGSSLENHRWDQSILSLLFHRNPAFNVSQVYWASWALMSWYRERWFPLESEGPDSVFIFSRRNHCPKPFVSHLIQKPFSQCLPLKQSLANSDWRKQQFTNERKLIPCSEEPHSWHLLIFLSVWMGVFAFVVYRILKQANISFVSQFLSMSNSSLNRESNKFM